MTISLPFVVFLLNLGIQIILGSTHVTDNKEHNQSLHSHNSLSRRLSWQTCCRWDSDVAIVDTL